MVSKQPQQPKASSSVWVPRAVRQVERAERAAAEAPPADEPDSGAGASGEAWHANDLEDLDESVAKRSKPAGDPVKDEVKEEDDAAARAASLEDEVIAGAPRLAQHIRSAQKCVKVAAMAYSLLEQGAVTNRSSGAFFLVVEAAMAEPMRPVADAKYRVCYRKLFEGVLRRKQAFSAEQQQQIDIWAFQLHTSLELIQADDSFAFSRASKKVEEKLERLKPDAMPPGKSSAEFEDVGQTAQWTPVLMNCLATAFMQYGKSLWAKSAVEGLVKVAMGCRKQWPAQDARQIEDWNQMCKGVSGQRKAQGGGSSFLTSFDADSARWKAADVSAAKKTGDGSKGMQN
ncbi:hypothetical protein T492DRAFT_1128132 [Pavlovales sp. CCMP2436]|nr:hypothetical protein T492DRAFT_1128132 [Pavlovales sp. CCMP2436]|mmetsp:Transcript_6667/g.17375  ORF Transcript_6667/g.17375 Transcript_6667/m.17375 type:complete len:343 (-) Transcript_6667:62-1090(-)